MMRKDAIFINAVLVILICFTSRSYGHDTIVNYELQFGPSVSYFIGNRDSKNYSPKINASIGLSVEFPIKDQASIVGSISFEEKGDRRYHPPFELYDSTYASSYSSKNLFYITFPILWRRYLGEEQSLYLEGGPYFAIRITDNTKTFNRILGRTMVYSPTQEHPSQYRRLDAGVSVGLGFCKDLSRKLAISISLRYNCGIINVIDDSLLLNNSLNLLIGLRFNR